MSNQATTNHFFNSTIPNDWEVKHFEDVAEIDKISLNGDTPKDYEFDYISLSDVDCDDLKIETTKQVFANAPSRARRVVKKGDVLMATVRPNLQGFSLIRDNVKDLIASTGFAVITTKKCSNEFLYQFLFSAGIARQFYQLLVGSNYPAINSSDVRKLKLPLPPLSEQKAIAHILSLMDSAINKNNMMVAKRELQKKWLMQNLLTGKKRLKGFEDKWTEYQVSQLFQTIDRYVKWDDDEKYNLVSVRRRNEGMFFREPLYGNKIEVKKLKEIKSDDFLISKRQVSHGAWAIVTEEFENGKVSDEYDCLVFQGKDKVSSSFWKWYCQLPVLTHYAYVDSNGVHVEKSIFDYNQFKKRIVNIPATLPEQTAIAQVLQAANREIQLLKMKTEKLREQKKGMMQLLLTGKKRLTIKQN